MIEGNRVKKSEVEQYRVKWSEVEP